MNFSLGPLRYRNFALIWSAALVSNVGSWMQTVAVGQLVTALTGQARWAGLVAAAAFLPVGLFAPLGGAMADRHDRRRWLLLTTVGETFFAATLAVVVASGHATPIGVTLLVLGGGCMSSVGFPAYSAMLPDLVDPEHLLGAISLSSAQFNLGRVIGPALAGVAIVAGGASGHHRGYALAFALNAASFAAVIVALLVVRLPAPEPSTETGTLLTRIAAGARVAWREPGCRAAIALIAVVALLVSPFIALIPAIAVKVFHNRSGGTAVLVTAQGIGAVAGALALAPLARRVGRRRLLVANLFVLPLTIVLYGVAPSLALAALAIAAVGMAYIGAFSGLNTVIQLRAPAAMRARLLSLYMVALGTVYPVAAVLQGAIGDKVGLRVVTVAGAGLLLVVVAILATAWPAVLADLDDPAGS